MPARIAQFYGLIILWHAIRHFSSYALLGSQSYFENPRPEWLILGLLQVVVGALLIWKPLPWCLVAAALILFLWGVAYPVQLHVGDSAFIMLLLGLAVVLFGGDAWMPLATAPSVIGLTLAGLYKLHGGNFSVCDLTNCVLVRFPWIDGVNLSLHTHQTSAMLMSKMTMGIELAAPCIWILLFFPKLWVLRSLLAILPISLLLGIALTGNLDEFPWVILSAFVLMLGPKQSQLERPIRRAIYPLAFVICAASLLNLGVNLQRIYSSTTSAFDRPMMDLMPGNRVEHMAIAVAAPPWNMYAGPVTHDQMFAGETNRILKLELRIKADSGCGLALDRWERIYWERIRRSLKDPDQHDTALMLRNKYKALLGQPCSAIVLPGAS